TPINANAFRLTQTLGDILARNRTIQTTFASNTRLKCQRDLTQFLGLLSVTLCLFLLLALLSRDTLLTIGNQRWCRTRRHVAWQQIVTSVAICHFLQVTSLTQALNIL